MSTIEPELDMNNWRHRQRAFLNSKQLYAAAAQLQRHHKTLARWCLGQIPIPLQEAWRVAHVTQDFRLLQSYAADYFRAFLPIESRTPNTIKEEAMEFAAHLIEFQALMLKLVNSDYTQEERDRLKELRDLLLADVVATHAAVEQQLDEKKSRGARGNGKDNKK